jgi:hypothetical protein
MPFVTVVDVNDFSDVVSHNNVQELLDFVNAFTLSMTSNSLAEDILGVTCRITITRKGDDDGSSVASPSVVPQPVTL